MAEPSKKRSHPTNFNRRRHETPKMSMKIGKMKTRKKEGCLVQKSEEKKGEAGTFTGLGRYLTVLRKRGARLEGGNQKASRYNGKDSQPRLIPP